MKKPKYSSKVRIIGGKWRGRKLPFPNLEFLRPTPDRVRETLFNWLAPIIDGAYCLDLFAGSGALGFEALSRGAGKVIFVDSEPQIIEQLKANQQILNCENIEIYNMSAEKYLQQANQPFDVIFLDPPFQQQAIPKYFQLLAKKNLIKPKGYIYIETGHMLDSSCLPQNWQIIKQKRAGRISYCLVQVS